MERGQDVGVDDVGDTVRQQQDVIDDDGVVVGCSLLEQQVVEVVDEMLLDSLDDESGAPKSISQLLFGEQAVPLALVAALVQQGLAAGVAIVDRLY